MIHETNVKFIFTSFILRDVLSERLSAMGFESWPIDSSTVELVIDHETAPSNYKVWSNICSPRWEKLVSWFGAADCTSLFDKTSNGQKADR